MTGGFRIGIALLLLSCLFPCLASPALGQPRSFMPVISPSEGTLEFTMISNANRNTFNGRGFDVGDLYFSEKIRLAADGYVYDPRFISFLASLAGGLRQERFSGVTGDGSWTGATVGEYNLSAVLLPQHPYNLQAYANHAEPFLPGTYAPGGGATVDNRGVIFSYKQNPLFLSTSYADTRVESRSSRMDTATYRADGSYSFGPLWNTAGYSHTDSRTSLDTRTSQNQFAYRNTLNVSDARLDSSVTHTTFTQTSLTTPYLDNDRFSWREQANLQLPAHLALHASYGYEYERDRTGTGPAADLDETWNRSNSASANLSHRLYQSLFTSYAWRSFDVESDTGSLKSLGNSLSTTYTKKIPTGLLSTGVSYAVTETKSQGTPTVVNEPHTAVYPFPDPTFTLNQRNVIENSVTIEVRDPSMVRYPLDPSMYQTRVIGGSLQITIISLPAPVTLVPGQSYEFFASYATTQAELTNSSFQYTARLNLLDNLLTPYYTYSNSVQIVEAGMIPGGPDRSSSNTAGVIVQSRPYTVTAERQDFRSRLSPFRVWRASMDYLNAVAPDTNLRGRLIYEWTDYLPAPAGSRYSGYTQRNAGVDLSVNKVFPREAVTLTLTGSSHWMRSLLDTNAYSLSGSVTWRIGLLTVSFNTIVSYRESTSATGTQTLASQYYTLTVTRKLF